MEEQTAQMEGFPIVGAVILVSMQLSVAFVGITLKSLFQACAEGNKSECITMELEKNLEYFRPLSTDKKEGIEGECSICLEGFKKDDSIAEILSCKHIFHYSCIQKWVDQYMRKCPYCRADMFLKM